MSKYEIDFSKDTPAIQALRRDIKRAVSGSTIEFDEQGHMVLGKDVNVSLGGVFTSAIARHDLVREALETHDPVQEAMARMLVAQMAYEDSARGYALEQVSDEHNLIPDAGLNHYLDVVLGTAGSTTQVTSWYFGLFKSNSTPAAGWLSTWAGALSGPLATELTQAEFNESGRQLAVFGAAAAKVKATSAPSVFTLATGTSGISLYGATLNSTATIAYNVADKVLVAATRFTTAKTGLGATDKANVEYTITGSST